MKVFTIEEAEGCLGVVGQKVRKVQRLREKISWLLESNEAVVEVNEDDGFHYFMTEQVRVNKEFHRLYFQFYRALEEIGIMGVIVKDIDGGLVDFPFRVNGKEAYLCWQLGEDRIKYWHDVDSGVDGRKPIVDLDDFLAKKSRLN